MNAPAQPVPQATPNGYPSMKVVRALAAASKRVAEVTCNGKSGDPRDPYAYARADDLVAAAKDAIHSEGLLVLPASSDEKPEAVGNGAVIWLRQTFNVVHVESGEWLPFQADPWPLQQNKPIDKAMATAKTASKAYFYLSLLEIRRVGPNAEDMDADLPPLSEQTANRSDKPAERSDKPITDSTQIGISAKAKRGGSAAHMAMKRENRQKVDPEENAAELAKFAAANFPTEGDPDMAPTPAPADDTTNRTQEAPPTRTEDLIHPASGTSSEAGTLNSGPNFLDQGEWAGLHKSKAICIAHMARDCAECGPPESDSESSAGGSVAPPSGSPAPGPRDECALCQADLSGKRDEATGSTTVTVRLDCRGCGRQACLNCTRGTPKRLRCRECEEHGDRHTRTMLQPTPEQVTLVASKASGVLSKRSAEGRAAKWATAKLTKARKAFGCDVCQPKDETGDRPGVLLDKFAIQPKAQYRDGQAGKACIPCWERLESEAAGAGKESAA